LWWRSDAASLEVAKFIDEYRRRVGRARGKDRGYDIFSLIIESRETLNRSILEVYALKTLRVYT
jgi:hypothetical protein